VPARVSIIRVSPIASFASREPISFGFTPISEQLLVAGEYLVSYSAAGMNPIQFILQAGKGSKHEVSRTLLAAADSSQNMMFVDEGATAEAANVSAFLVDKYEVANEEYLRFVSEGGYRNQVFWEPSILVNGQMMAWTEGVRLFVDRTGISGPRLWTGGKYPEGKAKHPVVGVSWYEASAYARWAGKSLPTWNQWWRAAKGESSTGFPWGNDVQSIELRANFSLSGTKEVDAYPLGLSPFGCYNMAGNVREWLALAEANPNRRTVVGGGWNDPEYMFEPLHAERFDPTFADEVIGFRCVKSVNAGDHK
jgi:formylglycine-generating enzyme required for sulfatase activity